MPDDLEAAWLAAYEVKSLDENVTFDHSISLPSGLNFHLPSRQMLGAAKFLRKEIFQKRRYCHEKFTIRPDATIVDIGANMGMFAMWAAPMVPRGRFIAIEPMDVINVLTTNVKRHNLENVTALKAAVGRDGEELEMVDYPGFNIITHQAGLQPAWITRFLISLLFFRERVAPVHVKAPCISLGTIMDRLEIERLDYLKIDCEGGEYDIVRNLADEHWSRIRRIAMEFHELQPDHKHEELVSRMQEQGFQVEVRKPFFDYRFMKFGELWAWRD